MQFNSIRGLSACARFMAEYIWMVCLYDVVFYMFYVYIYICISIAVKPATNVPRCVLMCAHLPSTSQPIGFLRRSPNDTANATQTTRPRSCRCFDLYNSNARDLFSLLHSATTRTHHTHSLMYRSTRPGKRVPFVPSDSILVAMRVARCKFASRFWLPGSPMHSRQSASISLSTRDALVVWGWLWLPQQSVNVDFAYIFVFRIVRVWCDAIFVRHLSRP